METKHCPTCQTPIPATAPGGFCPACLLRDAEEPPAYGHSAPPLEEIAAAFPQVEVLGLIGQGGMGFVYKVRQPSLDRDGKVKIADFGIARIVGDPQRDFSALIKGSTTERVIGV